MQSAASDAKQNLWKVFGILLGLGLLGVLAVMPYLVAVLAQVPAPAGLPPLPILVALQFLQSAVLLTIAVAAGLWLGRQIGCGAPLLEHWLAGKNVRSELFAVLRRSLSLGVSVGLLLLILLKLVFIPLVPQLRALWINDIGLWRKLLASFYGGTVEELLLRLFVLSLIAWLLRRLWRDTRHFPPVAAFWVATALSAALFGLGHLASAPLVGMTITPIVVIAALVLNGIAGLAFGYLYWRRGIEAAMLAHFSADIVLQGLAGPWLKA